MNTATEKKVETTTTATEKKVETTTSRIMCSASSSNLESSDESWEIGRSHKFTHQSPIQYVLVDRLTL